MTEPTAIYDDQPIRRRQVGGTHYVSYAIQPWDIIDCYGLDYYTGCILKYLLRRKPGAPRVQDLEKAAHYLEKLIARERAGE